ncbi:MAG TPA: hypothetical protein VJN96_09450 [Vicinamibacterales bacterium]|nr:hypothetical protein [Vicinamibacterales bacterium]
MSHERDVIALEIHCVHCHTPVTLYVVEWRGKLSIEDPSTWKCPQCQQKNDARFPGKLEFVVAGHDQT